LGCQVIDFIRLVLIEQIHQRALVMQIPLSDGDLFLELADALIRDGAGTAHHPDHPVTLGQQELCQVRAILPGNAGD
jgi:hypothetical protein